MKILDGKNATMGRLASYTAKEALKGEEIIILNCEEIIVTGSKNNIQKEFEEKRKKVGSGQLGPKVSKDIEKMVKRVVRGMLPHRSGNGQAALRRIRCYKGVPKEFEGKKIISAGREKHNKYIRVKEI